MLVLSVVVSVLVFLPEHTDATCDYGRWLAARVAAAGLAAGRLCEQRQHAVLERGSAVGRGLPGALRSTLSQVCEHNGQPQHMLSCAACRACLALYHLFGAACV
jgi:hypothetical protein